MEQHTTASGNKKLKTTPFAGFVPITRFDHRLVEIILERVRVAIWLIAFRNLLPYRFIHFPGCSPSMVL
jgi:hypothetical protein